MIKPLWIKTKGDVQHSIAYITPDEFSIDCRLAVTRGRITISIGILWLCRVYFSRYTPKSIDYTSKSLYITVLGFNYRYHKQLGDFIIS